MTAKTPIDDGVGFSLSKRNRIKIAKRAREIISDATSWADGRLREVRGKDKYSYCLLGACEQATYDLQLKRPAERAFDETDWAYHLGHEMGLDDLAREMYDAEGAAEVNDLHGQEAALKLLDTYVEEVERGAK